ncbi:hypothetical protein Bbelb_445000 [Branchiostoma belcheri]|nr:hypothetical protein Bbelb_445000 [Branchiostoma belcheri]
MAALRCQEELSDRGHFPIATSVINHPDPHELSGRHSGAEFLQVREFTFCIRRRSGTYYWAQVSGLILTTVPKQYRTSKQTALTGSIIERFCFRRESQAAGSASGQLFGVECPAYSSECSLGKKWLAIFIE